MDTKPEVCTLDTARLILREIRLSDAERIQSLFPHWEIVKYLNAIVPWPYPSDGAVRYLENILPEVATRDRYEWAITLKSAHDDLLIGGISLMPNNPEDNRGFWLAKDFQRNGYMTEAASTVTSFAFNVLGMPSLKLNNAEPNGGSHRIKDSSGARIVGIDDEFAFVGGKFRRIRWELKREDWIKRNH